MTQENESPEIPQEHPVPEPDSKPDIIEKGILPPEDRTTPTPKPPSPDDEE